MGPRLAAAEGGGLDAFEALPADVLEGVLWGQKGGVLGWEEGSEGAPGDDVFRAARSTGRSTPQGETERRKGEMPGERNMRGSARRGGAHDVVSVRPCEKVAPEDANGLPLTQVDERGDRAEAVLVLEATGGDGAGAVAAGRGQWR